MALSQRILIFLLFMVILKATKQMHKACVVTNGYGCSDIGASVIQKGGNAVDATIAALFCEGVSMPECMGLGGGFLLTLYNKTTGEVWTLNAREAAPGSATWDMYIKDPDSSKWGRGHRYRNRTGHVNSVETQLLNNQEQNITFYEITFFPENGEKSEYFLEMILNKYIRIMVNAPWYVRNNRMREDLVLPTIKQSIQRRNADVIAAAEEHSNKRGKAVAVPGELRGYWHLYQRFGGGVSWKELVQPTINMCKKGVYVTKFLEGVYNRKKDFLYQDPVLREIYINSETNDTYKEGQVVKLMKLAKTLEIIAEEGGDALNNGTLTEQFVADIRNKGGIITVEDMENYQPVWEKPVQVPLKNNKTLYTSPLPGSGIIVAHILNILTDFINDSDTTSITTNQRIVEAFKFAYGRRGDMGDPNFIDVADLIANYTSPSYAEEIRKYISDVETYQDPGHYGAKFTYPEDHGTAHISVLTRDGDAVSVTSTINLLFGAGFASNSTGIIMNNEMRDFSSPNITNGNGFASSPANFVAPGKRSMSAMCPSIVLDKNNEILLVIGGAGGPKITTSVAMVIMRHLWFGMDLKSAIDQKRLHHQLFPMEIIYDTAYETEGQEIVKALAEIGHKYSFRDDNGFAAITAISRSPHTGKVVGWSDMRRPGYTTYFDV